MSFDYNLTFDKDNVWSPFKNIFSSDNWKYDADNFIIKFLRILPIGFYFKIIELANKRTKH